MHPRFYTKYSKEKIKLASKPFASGGEGTLYHVVSPVQYKHLAAKIYHPEKRSPERKQKVIYLINNPPISISEKQHPPIGWPLDILYQKKEFVGLLIPLLKGQKLTMLTSAKLPRRINKAWHRFSLKNPNAFKLRLRLCFNIASTLYQIHNMGLYILVDLKPDNILVQSNGLVSIVDMDSVEVIEDGKVLFPAPVATPEYTPPEKYTKKRQVATPVLESWDRFSMAVIFYQLLFGLHPFAASSQPPYDSLVGLDDKIRHGLFVHNPHIQEHFKIIPPPHRKFDKVNPLLKDLFIECFVQGHKQADLRPTAEDWCAFLIERLQLPIKLEGVNASLKLADNYIKPSSIVNFNKILDFNKLDNYQSLLAALSSLEKEKYPTLFVELKTTLFPNAKPQEPLTKAVPTYTTPAFQKEMQQNLITANNFPDHHFYVVNDQLYRYQLLLSISVISSLVFLGLGNWLIAIAAIFPGLLILLTKAHISVPKSEAKKILGSVSTSNLLLHESQKEQLIKQLESTKEELATYQKTYEASFHKIDIEKYVSIQSYKTQKILLLEELQQLETQAKNIRKQEKQAHLENRKIYESAIQNYTFFNTYKSTSYNYLIRQLEHLQTTTAAKGLAYKEDKQILTQQYQSNLTKLKTQSQIELQEIEGDISTRFEKERAAFEVSTLELAQEEQLSAIKAHHQQAQQQLENDLKKIQITYKNEIRMLEETTFAALTKKLWPAYINRQYELAKTDLTTAHRSKLQTIEIKHKLRANQTATKIEVASDLIKIDAEESIINLEKKIRTRIHKLGRQIKKDKRLKQLTQRLQQQDTPIQEIVEKLISFNSPKLAFFVNTTFENPNNLFNSLIDIMANLDIILATMQRNWTNTKAALNRHQYDLIQISIAKKKKSTRSLKNQEKQLINETINTLNSYWDQIQKNIDLLNQYYVETYKIRKGCDDLSPSFIETKITELQFETQQKQIELEQQLNTDKQNAIAVQKLKYEQELANLKEKHQQELFIANDTLKKVSTNKNMLLQEKLEDLKKTYENEKQALLSKQQELELAQQQELDKLNQEKEKKLKVANQMLLFLEEEQEKVLKNRTQTTTDKYLKKQKQLTVTFEKKLESLDTHLEKNSKQQQEYLAALSFLNEQHALLEIVIDRQLSKYKPQYEDIKRQAIQLAKKIEENNLMTKNSFLEKFQQAIITKTDDQTVANKKLRVLYQEFKSLDQQLILKIKKLKELKELKGWLQSEGLLEPPK